MKYDAEKIQQLSQENLKLAKDRLSQLPIWCGHRPDFGGLHGWVYEQTIQFCLKEELAEYALKPNIEEHFSLGGRAKPDLRIEHVLIEVKTRGLFSVQDVERYNKYGKLAKDKKLQISVCHGF